MTGDEYRYAIEALGLNLTSAAKLFDVTRKTSNRWAAGATPVPWSTATLLELMLDKKLELEIELPDCSQLWQLRAKRIKSA
jgi:plasmid maintenance system antidote protein VapI